MKLNEEHYAGSFTVGELEDIVTDGRAHAADGCLVEPDGTCPHGYRSPLLILGLI